MINKTRVKHTKELSQKILNMDKVDNLSAEIFMYKIYKETALAAFFEISERSFLFVSNRVFKIVLLDTSSSRSKNCLLAFQGMHYKGSINLLSDLIWIVLVLSMINQIMRKNKIENVQYRACIAITGAIQGTS